MNPEPGYYTIRARVILEDGSYEVFMRNTYIYNYESYITQKTEYINFLKDIRKGCKDIVITHVQIKEE